MNPQEETPLLKNSPKLPTPCPSPPTPPINGPSGLTLMAISSLFFSITSFLVHVAITILHVPAITSVLLHATVQFTLSLTYIIHSLPTAFTSLSRRQAFLLICRGGSGSLCMVSIFIALSKLPLGIVTTLFFVTPVLTMLLSFATLGETITRKDIFASLISFTGILLISQPDLGTLRADRMIGILATCAASFFGATAYVLVRTLGTDVHFMICVWILSVGNLVLSFSLGGLLPWEEFAGKGKGVALTILSALFGFAGQCFMNSGLQRCKAGVGTLVRNIEIPLSYIWGIVFLSEKVSTVCIFGSVLVMFSSVILGMGA